MHLESLAYLIQRIFSSFNILNRHKYIVRAVAINLIAVYVAYRITMAFFLEDQEMLKNAGLGGVPMMDPTDAEF